LTQLITKKRLSVLVESFKLLGFLLLSLEQSISLQTLFSFYLWEDLKLFISLILMVRMWKYS